MDPKLQRADEFFNRYRDVFNAALTGSSADIEQTAGFFSTCFIAANPTGVNCGKNDETFRKAMQQGYAFYKSIGVTSMDVISKNITLLNDWHIMARIGWKCNYNKNEMIKGNIEFENIYFMQLQKDHYKVFAYITGDEQAALKEAGLI